MEEATPFFVGNFALLLVPAPHVHLCLFPIAFILGPLIGWSTWRRRVLLGPAPLPCPRCSQTVTVPDALSGWPARFNCVRCGIMVELNEATRA